MPNTEKVYSKITEAEEIIQELCKKYPDELWAVRPDIVTVLGIENKERGEKNKKLAKIIPIKNPTKSVLQIYNVMVRYIIEVYWSDWNEWCRSVKEWIVFHELLHIPPDIGKTVKHDCEDFRMILDVVGVDWTEKGDKLPNLLGGDKVKFNLDLRPALTEMEEGDEIIDDKNKEDKKDKKEENVEIQEESKDKKNEEDKKDAEELF